MKIRKETLEKTKEETTSEETIRRLQDELGFCMYDSIISFISEIVESTADFIILMGRRFLDLYLEFTDIIKKEPPGTVISNLSMATVDPKQLKESDIMVVDDTMIHGRALYDVYKYLVNTCECEPERLTFKVFLKNESRRKIKPDEKFDFDKFVKAECVVDEAEWKWRSASMINSFLISGQPYISFLPYFEICEHEEERVKIIKRYLDSKYEMTIPEQQYYGVRAWLIEDNEDSFNQSKQLIRLYHYDKLKKYIIIPYYFMPAIDRETTVDVLKSYYKKGKISFSSDWFPNYLEEAIVTQMPSEVFSYGYNVLTYILSKAFGEHFMKKAGIKSITWNKSIEQKSLYCNNVCSDQSILEDWYAKIEQNYKKVSYEEKDIQDIIKEVWECGKKDAKTDVAYFLQQYYLLCRIRDEGLVEEKRRLSGFHINDLFNHTEFQFDEYQCWKEIINMCDMGRTTLFTEEFPGYTNKQRKIYQETLLKAGEQSFSCNNRYLICFAYPLSAYCAYCKKMQIKNEIKKVLDNMIQYIVDAFPVINQSLTKEQRETVREELEKGYQDDSFCVQYYRDGYNKYKNDSLMKEVMKKVMDYEKSYGKS